MSPLTLCAIAVVIAGIALGIIGELTHVATLKPSPKGITVMVVGGGELFDKPFPREQARRELEKLTGYADDLHIGRIITRGRLEGEKYAEEWALENGVEYVVLTKPRLFENIYETMISAGQPDVIIQLAGKWDDWTIARDALRKAGFDTAHWWMLASTHAKPEWITDHNSVVRPENNPHPRLPVGSQRQIATPGNEGLKPSNE